METQIVLVHAYDYKDKYQYFCDGKPTNIEDEVITASSDSNDIKSKVESYIEEFYNKKYGEVTHDKDCIFIEIF